MKVFNKLIGLVFAIVLSSGCTSIGSYIVSKPETFLSEAEFIDVDPQQIGYTKHRFCSAVTEACIHYLSAPPYLARDFADGRVVFYNLHAVGNGVENVISHRMTPDTFGRIKGTAVLLHGYGGNKEVMLASSIYFRALGMDVIIPDLFGHGESTEQIAFATKEHSIISELIAEKDINSNDLVVPVGHSMGTVTASNLLRSKNVDAAILLAPMMRFDHAAKAFLPYKAPVLSQFLSKNTEDIVNAALTDANVQLSDTDLLKPLSHSSKPILLINSNVDSVSPPRYFNSVNNERVTKLVFQDRAHASLMVFDSKDAKLIEQWLLSL